MPVELKIDLLKKLTKIHRAVYIFLVFITLVLWGASKKTDLTQVSVIYFCSIFILMLILDEVLYKPKEEIWKGKYFVRALAYMILIALGEVLFSIPVAMGASLILFESLILLEAFVFGDVFASSNNLLKRGVLGSVLALGALIPFHDDMNAYIIVGLSVSFLLMVFLVDRIGWIVERCLIHLDDRYTNLYFKNVDILEENRKLLKFREKVEKVNSEINYQKINLTKANNDLEKKNEETRSLIDVMKFFSSSFDVEENAKYMVENIMKVKKTAFAAFYIAEDTFMNEENFLYISANNETYKKSLSYDIESIYLHSAREHKTESFIITENAKSMMPFLTDMSVSCIMAFPAFENETIYGVMLVGSSNYDFFKDDTAFYESSLMDFTSALISDRLYKQTEDMAKKDGLTKIYNRIYFNQIYPKLMEDVKKDNRKLVVAMLDIDHFKNVNDTYGHLAGDEVIKMVARHDQNMAKKYKGRAVRFGGEEFLLVLPDYDLNSAYDIMKEMHDAIIEDVVHFDGLDIKVNTSMGLASYPETTDNVEEVVDRSDHAMYYSKEHGRGRIIIDGREEETV